MKSLNKYIFYLLLLAGFSMAVLSCQKEDPDEQIDPDKIELLSFGPSPALRGAELQVIGRNLDKVTAIVLPENISISTFNSKSSTKLTLTIPQATVDGKVVLKTPQGDITSKALLTISEPIAITAITPAQSRPGELIKITGTYLNLVTEVIFKDKKSVLAENFVSHSQELIELRVPTDAQTGELVLTNGKEDPILVTSEEPFVVTLPAFTNLSPNPVKAGKELTITGTNLDLVKEIFFGGNRRVLDFNAQSVTQIKVQVPPLAQDGAIKFVVASKVEVTSEASLELLVPGISEVTPNPVKPGTDIIVSGIDLDLVTSINFGGGILGTIKEKSATSLLATVPLSAIADLITINTAANKSVTSTSILGLIAPVITGLSQDEIKSNEVLTIYGTDLDLVTKVTFMPGNTVTPISIEETQLTVRVPPGTVNGSVAVVTTNGSVISSEAELVILASNVPVVIGYPALAKPGELITLTGSKMDLQMDVIFPGNAVATQFGMKTPDILQVVVPVTTETGVGVITFVTFEGETTTSPAINFQGVDPVQDQSLVFFDFNGNGDKDSWWGNVQIVNDENSLDGTSYGKITGEYNGWTDLFWRNSNNNFPGSAIGTNVDDFVIKFDINVIEPITGGNLKLRLHPADDDYWWALGPAAPQGGDVVQPTNGWITITVELSEFKNNFGYGEDSPADLTEVSGEFGMAFDNGASSINVLIDNVRFERK